MKTTLEELPENRVRLEVEVPEHHVKHAFEHAAADLSESVRIPGFRKGKKVPMPVLMARVGKEAVAAEAVRSHLDSWFWEAAASSGVRPVGPPEVEWDELPESTGTFRFRATVPVVPRPALPDLAGIEVGEVTGEVPSEVVDTELERLRAAAAELVPVTGRPVEADDTLVLDLVAREEGKEPSEHRDYVVELGSGRLADEIEAILPGTSEGETKTVELALDDGSRGTVEVTVKEIKQKVLPELDDGLAGSVSEFETLAELRSDVEARLGEQLQAELEVRFRQDALDAVVEKTTFERIEPLVDRRAAALLEGLARSLGRQGVSAGAYLQATGQTPEALQESARAEAELAVKRELVLEAAAAELGVEVTDGEIEELIRSEATEAGEDAEQAIAVMRERGAFEQVRGDLQLRKALDQIVARVGRIPMELAKAREKLWTPEKEKGGSGMKIWTPGSEEQP